MLSVAFLLNLTLVGFILTYLFKLRLLIEERILTGVVLALTIFGYVMLGLSHLLGFNVLSLVAFSILFNFVGLTIFHHQKLVLIIRQDIKDLLIRYKRLSWQLFIVQLGLISLIFWYLTSKLIIYHGGLYFVKPMHAFGDISGHLGLISSFAYGDNIPIQNPILAGEKISYPFLFDFITAIFVNPLNLSLHQAIDLTGSFMMIILIFSLGYFMLHLIQNKLVVILAVLFFFFNGGLGFLYFFQDLQNANFNVYQFIEISRDYTALKEQGIWWINIVISMLLPQRAVLLGLPIFLFILRIFWQLSDNYQLRLYILGLVLIIFLPLIHFHSFFALSPFILWYLIRTLRKYPNKSCQIVLLGCFALIIILLLSKMFLSQSQTILSFFRFQLGWIASGKDVLIFYLKNFGFYLLALPLSVIAYLKYRSRPTLLILIGQLWLVLPSLLVFQPWDYDNTKLLIYWLLFSSIILAHFIDKIIRSAKFVNVVLVLIFTIFLIFSGVLDIARLIYSPNTTHQIYSEKDFKIAEFIRKNTPKDAIFLSVDKFDNPIVTLAGRKTVLGFRGWLWTHGLNFAEREKEVRILLSGMGNKNLFNKYYITHVILFDEPTDFIISKTHFDAQFRKIYDQDGFFVYKL